ncbi:Peptidase M20 domain-containing protein [Lachnellula hyalina]|uniref:Peptidase M20 domain-containing protein 2 n=1 Tax=Lachnellula hyalina TaxID=1316788 RepID=A0A8H8QZP0_9HELO|nr:Peptidase M20 domain-containing protein [Lachnellula hyalina]TVY25658.1 Peptidase M20 domain-containing protein [Lachnellula hyalina]
MHSFHQDIVDDDYVNVSQEVEHQGSTAVHDGYLNYVSTYIDSISEILRPISLKIHDNPELKFEEFIAHETLTKFLKTRKGWKVTPSAYGMATAFVAGFDTGREGPVISYNVEYANTIEDALTGIGHSCGHNLIAICSIAAALAAASAMSEFSLPGKVLLFGTPGEEGGGGKIKLLDAGAYTEHRVDINLISHPGNVPDSALVRTNAYESFTVEYFGKEAHAAASPWEGVNALDGLITGYNALSVLRQQTMPGDIIQGHITHGGSTPNIIHAYAAGVFVVRATTKKRLVVLRGKVVKCFEAGAQASGAELKITPGMEYDDHVPNKVLGGICRGAFNGLGGEIPSADLDLIWGASGASTDQGNVSYAMPSLSLGFKIESEDGPHNPGFAKAARTREAHGAALRAGKALAVTGLEIVGSEDLLRAAREEFEDMLNGEEE